MTDDITFCGSDCNNKKCFRHPSNIQEPRIPHSFAYLKDTDDCPYKYYRDVDIDEAIECLQAIKSSDFPNGVSKWTVSIDMAIKALEHQKVEEERQKLKEKIWKAKERRNE